MSKKIWASVLGGFGIVGVINNINWITLEQMVALIISIIFLFSSSILFSWDYIKKKKKKKKK